MVGVDEDTALIGTLNGEWKAMGKSQAHVFTRDSKHSYNNGDAVPIN
jgi:cyanophycinase-like exopeptidase